MTAAGPLDHCLDAYVSTNPVASGEQVLDICGYQVSGDSRHAASPADGPLDRLSAAGWLADRQPLTVLAWENAVVAKFGHHARSVYVETFWLPVVGPSATWILRRLVAWLDSSTGAVSVDMRDLSAAVGLGLGTGRSSPVVRSLARLLRFRLAATMGDELLVSCFVPPLPHRLVRYLPGDLQTALRDWGDGR